MNSEPKANGANGRDGSGRFIAGNRGGPGNPHSRAVAHLRGELLRIVKPADLEAVVVKLIDAAKAGEPWAVRELLDRTLGKPVSTVELAGADRTDETRRRRIVICVSPEAGERMRAKGHDVREWENRPGL